MIRLANALLILLVLVLCLSCTNQTTNQIRAALYPIAEVKVTALDDGWVVRGELDSTESFNRLQEQIHRLQSCPGKNECQGLRIWNLTELSKAGEQELVDRISVEIEEFDIRVRYIQGNLILEGTVENNFRADRAVEITKTIAFPNRSLASESKGMTMASGNGPKLIVDLLRILPPEVKAKLKNTRTKKK